MKSAEKFALIVAQDVPEEFEYILKTVEDQFVISADQYEALRIADKAGSQIVYFSKELAIGLSHIVSIQERKIKKAKVAIVWEDQDE